VSAYVPAALKRLVRERFANQCAYCRTAEDLTATHFEIEHIDPRAADGETVIANLCLACPMCNVFKSDSSSAVDRPALIRVRQMWVAMAEHPPQPF
jgi:5-methylcytosine-specific restriction endonuclease McrA